jgi:hypothetical protein
MAETYHRVEEKTAGRIPFLPNNAARVKITANIGINMT